MAISFTFAPKELYRCLVDLTLHQRFMQVLALVDLLLAALLAATSSIPSAVVLLFVLLFIVAVVPAVISRRTPSLQGPLDYRFGPNDVQVNTVLGKSNLRWDAFVDLRSTPRAHYLRQVGKRNVLILPRRAFPPEADERFLSLAKRKLPH